MGITVDNAGNVYVADTGNSVVRRISFKDGAWITTTLAGHVQAQENPNVLVCALPCVKGMAGSRDGNLTYAQFSFPTDIAMGPHPNTLLVADNDRIRRISFSATPVSIQGVSSSERVVTVAGTRSFTAGAIDGDADEATFHVSGVSMSTSDGRVYMTSSVDGHIRSIVPAHEMVSISIHT
jgi:hypothetical protein